MVLRRHDPTYLLVTLLTECLFSLGLIFSLSFIFYPPNIFRCICYVHNLDYGFDKLDQLLLELCFLAILGLKGECYYNPVLRHYFNKVDITFLSLQPIFGYLFSCERHLIPSSLFILLTSLTLSI